MDLRIFVCTWNVAQSSPPSDAKDLESLLQIKEQENVDVYAIGFQEIKTGARETMDSFINYDDWAKSLSSLLSKKNYYMVENVRVQGLSVSLFAALKHLPYIRLIQTEIERTGVASAWGDKGGVAISCRLYGQKVCFLNAHLSAHLENEKERIEDVKEIFREMEFKGKSTVLSHDLVLMFGDLNFRIDDLSREFVIKSVEKKDYSVLRAKDQLRKCRQTDEILSQFEEAILDFAPTYKYDPGTDTYDTSQKNRKPAWTDRVLWRIHPEMQKTQPGSHFLFSLVDGSFKSLPSFKQSDHKPVICQFNMKITKPKSQEPLLNIEPLGNWTCGQRGHFKIEPCEGMEWNSKDYVGLYKTDLKDFRSYETFIYVPDFEDSSSSSSSSSEDEGVKDASKEFIRKATLDSHNKVMKSLKFKKSQVKDPGSYRLGYYSYNLSCLVAVSKIFHVK